MMKFEDFLTRPSDQQSRRMALEEEVEELQERLNGELKLNDVLRYALKGPVLSCPPFPSNIPLKVKMLLAELEMVEKEITWLETKLGNLKISLYREKKVNKEEEMQPRKRLQMQLPCRQQNQRELKDMEVFPARLSHHSRRKTLEEGRLSLSSFSDHAHSCSSARFKEQSENGSLRYIETKQTTVLAEAGSEEPNRLSEELLKCLIRIFLKMKQRTSEGDGTTTAAKLTPNCMNSRGISTKTTFSCKARSHSTIDKPTSLDLYDAPDSDGTAMNVGPYRNLIQITRRSLTTTQISDSYPTTRKLR